MERTLYVHKELKKASSRLRREPRNEQLLQYVRGLRKQFRKLIRRKKTEFKNEIVEQLDTLSEHSPGEFWKLFTNNFQKQGRDNPISASDWFLHFSKLMTSAQDNHITEMTKHMDKVISDSADRVFNELDFTISVSEVHSAISRLNYGKAAGLDQIPNESWPKHIVTCFAEAV